MNVDNIIETTKNLIRFKTVSGNYEEFENCSNYIKSFFGVKASIKEFKKEDVKSILVTRDATLEPSILIACHMDVVPGDDDLFKPKEEGKKLYGRGSFDDKGPLAIAMHLVREEIQRGNDVALLVTGDEEKGGFKGARHVIEQGLKPGFGIIIDGGGPNKYIIKSKGILQIRLVARGIESHGSRPWQGDNAISKLIKDWKIIESMFPLSNDEEHWHSTANLAKIEGGDAINKVPDKAEGWIDIRYVDSDDPEELINRIRSSIDSDVDVIMKEPCFTSDKDDDNVRHITEISSEIYGEAATITHSHGGSDARHFKDIATIITDPGGEGMHTKGECLYTDSIEKLYSVISQFCEKKLNNKG